MKKIKKLLAMLMAMTMVLGMSATVFVEPSGYDDASHTTTPALGTAADTGTIKVSGITDATEGLEVWAFQIIKANYEGTGNKFSGYQALYSGSGLTLNEDGEVEQSGTALEQALAKIENTVKYENNAWTGVDSNVTPDYGAVQMSKSNNDYTLTVPVGSYLVVVKGAESKTYNPIVVSVSYVNVGDSIESSTLNIANGQAWAKESDGPTITKEATVPEGNTDEHSVNVGDVITYTVTVPTIPQYEGQYPKFSVVDTLGTGLTFEGTAAQVEVYAGGTEPANKLTMDSDYTATINGKVLKVDFVVNGSYKLNGKTGALTVKYTAKVTTDALMNSQANANSAVLNYSKDSNIDADPGTTPPADTKNYTFDLSLTANGTNGTEGSSFVTKTGEIKKTDGTTEYVKLGGAEFTLYTEESCAAGKEYKNDIITDGKVTSLTVAENASEAEKAKEGNLVIRGLAAGTYYLKETNAPAGYSLNGNIYKIVLTATYDPTGSDELKGWKVDITCKAPGENTFTAVGSAETVDGGQNFTKSGTPTGKDQIEIPNTQLASLPSTGGIGTTIFTVGGCALMILAAALYFATRRKTAK